MRPCAPVGRMLCPVGHAVGARAGNAEELRRPERDEMVGRAVVPETADTVLFVVFVWNGKYIRFFRQGGVKSGVEHSHMGNIWRLFGSCPIAHQDRRVVQRGKTGIIVDKTGNFFVDNHRLRNFFTPEDHPVSYRVNFIDGIEDPLFGIDKDFLDQPDPGFVVRYGEGPRILFLPLGLKVKNPVVMADPFDKTLAPPLLCPHIDKLKFNGAATAVND